MIDSDLPSLTDSGSECHATVSAATASVATASGTGRAVVVAVPLAARPRAAIGTPSRTDSKCTGTGTVTGSECSGSGTDTAGRANIN